MPQHPPLPPGFKLDNAAGQPPLPPGFTLDGESEAPTTEAQWYGPSIEEQVRKGVRPEDTIPYPQPPASTPAPFDKYANRSAGQIIRDDLASAGRSMTPIIQGGINAVNALPVLAQDLGVSIRNLFPGQNYELPSHMYQRALDETFPMPNVPGDQTLRFGTSLIGGGLISAPTKLASSTQLAPAAFKTAKESAKELQRQAALRVIEEGKKRGVPVYADDVIQNPILRRASVMAEQVPVVGTSAGRAAQNAAAQQAAARTVDRLNQLGAEDLPAAIQKSLGSRLASFKTSANTLYTKATGMLDGRGDVPLSNFSKMISAELEKQAKLGSIASPDVVRLLQKYQAAPRGEFSMAREIRSQLGSDIADFYNGANKTIGEKGVGALQAIKSALERDMEGYAKSVGGEAYKAWRQADGFYKANIIPFKEAGFRELVKTAEPEKAWKYLVAQGGLESRAARMYNSLDESGRAAVRYGLASEAMKSATNPQGVFSPARFAKYLEDHEATVSTFFRGSDREEMRGLQVLMRSIQRAGQFAENPPTGQRIAPYIVGGVAGTGAVSHPVGTALGGAGVYGFTKLLQTESGRNILLSASRVSPDSPGAQVISRRAAQYLAPATAASQQWRN